MSVTAIAAERPKNAFPAPVYVTLQGSNQVEILPGGKICDGLPGAHYVAVNPDGSRMLVSSANQPEAYLVDTHDCTKLATFDVGPVTQGVRASRNGHWVYAGVTGTNTVAVIDTTTLDVVKQMPISGEIPFWIAVAGHD